MKCIVGRISVLLFICLLFGFISACKTVPAAKQDVPLPTTAEVLNRVTQQMLDDLDLKIGLKDKMIQLSENSFWQFDTEINLPFSAVLRDHVTTALSDRGAIVAFQNMGLERWHLAGKYGKQGNELVITIGAVRTTISESGNFSKTIVATASGKVPFGCLEPKWFEPEFSRIARTILRILDRNYSGSSELPITVCRMKPGQHGQPSLHLGREFQKFLETAIADSPVFFLSSSDSRDFGDRMVGTYTIVSNQMRFHVKVIDSEKRTLTSADFSVDLDQIPADLLKPVADSALDVCVEYVQDDDSRLPETSPAVHSLLAYLMDDLAAYNLKAKTCEPEKTADFKVEARLNIQEKSTPDGFRIVLVSMRIMPVRSDNKIMGTVNRNGRKIFGNNPENAVKRILQQIFTEKPIGEELATMMLGR